VGGFLPFDPDTDHSSLLPFEARLSLAYRELLLHLTADAEARQVFGSAAADAGAYTPFIAFLLTFSETATTRLMAARQQAVQASAGGAESQARITVAERDIALLKEELARKRRLFARETTVVDSQIRTVRAELQELVEASESAFVSTQMERERTLGALTSKFAVDSSTLESELGRLQTALQQQVTTSHEAEAAQRKRRARAYEEAKEAASAYDSTMGAMDDEMRRLRGEIAADAPALADLEQYYRRVDEEERRRVAEAKEAYWRLLYRMEDHVINVVLAVARIKIWWANRKAKDATLSNPTLLAARQRLRAAAAAEQERAASRAGSRGGNSAPGSKPGSAARARPGSSASAAATANAARVASASSQRKA
jgi:hypothetical protein